MLWRLLNVQRVQSSEFCIFFPTIMNSACRPRQCAPHTPPTCSWLASVPTCLLLSGSNQQIVPSLRGYPHCGLSNFVALASLLAPPSAGLPATATAAAAGAVAVAAAPSVGFTAADADDASTTRARLYCLYDFFTEHARLPDVQDTHQGVAVGQWAEKCRQLQQQQALDSELASALQSIPGWSWQPQVEALSDSFQESLQQLVAYAHQYGPPPQRQVKREAKSSSSRRSADDPPKDAVEAVLQISKQFVERRKRGVLTRQQIDNITQQVPGWRWDVRIRAPPLDEMLQLLQAFHAEHGRLPRPDERTDDGFLIGEWCMARRGEYSRGQLEVDVAAVIESQVPGWLWNKQENVFEKNLAALAGFVAENGRMPTQRETWCGVRVGAWCNKRRLQYKAGQLAADRVAALEAIPGWWWNCDQMPDVGV